MIALALLAAAAALRPGVYGDVVTSRESGDYDGVELCIPSADARAIDVTVCEGGCSLVEHPAIVRTEGGFRFDLDERAMDAEGRPTVLLPRHADVRIEGRGLRLTWLGEGTTGHLRRLAHPYALGRLPHEAPVLVR